MVSFFPLRDICQGLELEALAALAALAALVDSE
jgi:hypothetical protein